jgi:hypothetical protein
LTHSDLAKNHPESTAETRLRDINDILPKWTWLKAGIGHGDISLKDRRVTLKVEKAFSTKESVPTHQSNHP